MQQYSMRNEQYHIYITRKIMFNRTKKGFSWNFRKKMSGLKIRIDTIIYRMQHTLISNATFVQCRKPSQKMLPSIYPEVCCKFLISSNSEAVGSLNQCIFQLSECHWRHLRTCHNLWCPNGNKTQTLILSSAWSSVRAAIEQTVRSISVKKYQKYVTT